MAEVEIKFEREGLEGVIPVGSYVGDALRRFGVPQFERCTAEHDCVVKITRGEELLSDLTSAEKEHFAAVERKPGERLACQAKIERPGEIVVMTNERKEEPKAPESEGEQYRKQFSELPLDQKISELVKLEAIALGETVSYIVNSPFAIFEKVGDMMAGIGMKLEKSAKEAQRPVEHTASGTNKKKSSSKKKQSPDDKE
jgi:ferredoxin